MIENLRNIAIIAHVDHGKTTLVDKLLRQSGTLERNELNDERVMDSNDQEKERGITILAKNTAINWNGYHINIVDTPGHADFGGEVERVMSMVDSVLLLVDAQDGPMPQTRFVTKKAFEAGLRPIVCINKVDRPGARPDWVLDQIFDLFDNLGATEEQLDFQVIYASALNGIAGLEHTAMAEDMTPLYQAIVDHVPPPKVDRDGPFQMQISALDYNSFLGVIGVGRIARGSVKPNTPVVAIGADGKKRNGRILKLMGHHGLHRIDVEEAFAGDIVCVSGMDSLFISDTLCQPDTVEAMKPLTVDEPTVSMTFQVNDSPFCGKEGKFVTSRNIKERLDKELLYNVALRVEEGDSADKFKVSGRGELHLSVLIENMRREGYEFAVSKAEVIYKEDERGRKLEPMEIAYVDVPDEFSGTVIQLLSERKGELHGMSRASDGSTRLEFEIPARGLIGFRGIFMTSTKGTGILNTEFEDYAPYKGDIEYRKQGSLIAFEAGESVTYGLYSAQERGTLFIGPGEKVYAGMVIGQNGKAEDIELNVCKTKHLTNTRTSSSDEALRLTPPRILSLEQALDFIDKDELLEVTPVSLRIRKKELDSRLRKRAAMK